MVHQVLHEHAASLSAATHANRNRRLIKCAKDSGHYRSSASSQARKLLMASSICSPVRAFSSWWITRFRSARSRPSLCSFTYLTASSRRSCDASQGGADAALGLASHVEFATYHEVGSRRHRMPLNRDEPHIETVATIKLTHCRTWALWFRAQSPSFEPVQTCRSTIGQRGNLITRPPSSDRATFGVHNARSRPPLFERVAIVSRARLCLLAGENREVV